MPVKGPTGLLGLVRKPKAGGRFAKGGGGIRVFSKMSWTDSWHFNISLNGSDLPYRVLDWMKRS